MITLGACFKLLKTSLGLLSLLDLFGGTLLIVYVESLIDDTAVDGSESDGEVQYLVLSLLFLAVLLLISSILAFVGTLRSSLTCLLLCSSYTSGVLILLEISSAFFIAISQKSIGIWIGDHADELNLSSDQVEAMRTRTFLATFLLLAMVIVEILRYALLRKVRKQIIEGVSSFREALREEDREEESAGLRAKLLVEEKYSDLRNK
jgi:hypothetical protein